ncbi:uncharacterized protein LOC123296317 [Chrysoperla carnea]|uniref:uncharacterized protein LOC123296317 n=1 Tax=Chrysoperla carnea TaxID=189513 RepID=UPI001D05D66C|nr:uncharacterized protein LOC123296317 [Chrysoperla carnea]
MGVKRIWKLLVRRKVLEEQIETSSSDDKPHTFLDLFGLGINSVFGIGFYSIIGYLSYHTGPSVIISIIIAAAAAILSSLCYAEFGVRIRQGGSSYIFSYVTLGEWLAFIVGWTLLLEFITGIANLSRDISFIIDTMTNGEVYDFFQTQILTIDIEYFSSYIDFIALGIPIILAILIQIPIPRYPKLQKFIAIINIILGLTIIIIIACTQDFDIAWDLDSWFPNGVSGFLKSIPICFCVFMSIEFIIMAQKDLVIDHIQQKSTIIPMIMSLLCNAISVSLIIFVTYFVVRNYDVNEDPRNIILEIFIRNEVIWAKWFAIFCQMIAIIIGLYMIMIAMPKILYKMVHDSILFKCFGRNSDTYKKPFVGTLLMTLISGLLGAFFSNEFLLNILALCILLTFTLVAVSTLVLRYTDGRIQKEEYLPSEMKSTSISNLIVSEDHVTMSDYFGQLFNTNNVSSPTPVTTLIVQINTTFFCIFALLLNGFLVFGDNCLYEGQIWIIVVISVLILLHIITLLTISVQPTNKRDLSFKVPMVPICPAISVLINIYIMFQLEYKIWIGLGIWIAIGLCVYFTCLKIYKRSDNKSTFSLNRKTLNGIMNFAYDNELNFEVAEPLPKQNTPPTIRASKAINLRLEEDRIESIKNVEEIETISRLEEMIEENDIQKTEFTENEVVYDKISIDDDENEEYQREKHRASSATYVLDMLDKVLAYESDDSDELSTTNRKTSFDTESVRSTTDPIEHSALVHREDSTKNVQNLIIEPEKESHQTRQDSDVQIMTSESEKETVHVVPPPPPPIENLNLELAEEDDVVEDISKLYDTIPKTPNVSRVESMMRPKQLQEKPHNKGLYKPEIYDDEEVERKLSTPAESNSGLLAEINKEILARKKLCTIQHIEKNGEPNDNTEEEESEESMKPSDIRNKLELIYKTGPRNPEEKQKTLRKTIAVIPYHNPEEEPAEQPSNAIDDPNSSSLLAQQLRARKTLFAKPDSGIDSGNSSTISNDETRQEKHEVSEEEPEIETPSDIRMRLNQILSKGPQHPSQLNNSNKLLPISVPKVSETNEEPKPTTNQIQKEVSETPRSSVQSESKVSIIIRSLNDLNDREDSILAHKKLMGNVFKSIKERKSDSPVRSDSVFLTKLQSQNERIKNNEVISVTTKL